MRVPVGAGRDAGPGIGVRGVVWRPGRRGTTVCEDWGVG